MRILHIITNTDLGGAQRVVIDLCTMAIADGHTVAVASMPTGYMWNQLPSSVKQFHLPHMVKPINLIKEFPCLLEIRHAIKEFKPDVIHLHSSKAAVLGRIACPKKLRKHIVYTVHGFDTIRIRNRVFLPLERFFQNWCGVIVPVSAYDEHNLISEHITKNIHLIRNAVPLTEALPEDKLPETLKKARMDGKKIILTIARIALPKRVDIFTETARLVNASATNNLGPSTQQESIPISFFWIGSPTDSSLNKELLSSEKTGYISFLGDIPDASRLIPYSDVFVLFSDYEGMPITILEALSKGKPIIASKVGGIPELVDSTNGVLLNLVDEQGKPFSTNEIANKAAKAINTLLLDKNKYENACISSLKKYNNFFTLDTMWKNYLSTYQNVCK